MVYFISSNILNIVQHLFYCLLFSLLSHDGFLLNVGLCICIFLFVWLLLGLIWGCVPLENIYFSVCSQNCFQPGIIFNFSAFDLLDHASGTNLNPKSHDSDNMDSQGKLFFYPEPRLRQIIFLVFSHYWPVDFSFFFFFKFYFIFKLYITVLVLPNIKMNPPQVYMCWSIISLTVYLLEDPASCQGLCSNLFSLKSFLLSSNDYVNPKLLRIVKANAPWTAVASPQA